MKCFKPNWFDFVGFNLVPLYLPNKFVSSLCDLFRTISNSAKARKIG